MKKLFLGLVIGAAAGAFGMWWTHRSAGAEPTKADEAAKPAEAAKENPLHVPAAKRTALGITLAAPTKIALTPEAEAFGRVLDPTPYVALVAEQATATASLAASEKELARVQKLFAAGGNASAQAVETAEAAAARDRAAVASARIRLLATWGPKLAEDTDLDRWRDTLVKGAALVRLDLLPGTTVGEMPKTAHVSVVGTKEAFEAEILSPAPVADPQVQGASFLALVRAHSLPAGASLQAKLPGPGEATEGLTLPRAAVVYHQGSPWVYVLGEEDNFERKLVRLGESISDRIVITSGVTADEQVVTTGAQQLLSAELQAGGSGSED
jgi:hypothetical protein